jgi:hypothetical protein
MLFCLLKLKLTFYQEEILHKKVNFVGFTFIKERFASLRSTVYETLSAEMFI